MADEAACVLVGTECHWRGVTAAGYMGVAEGPCPPLYSSPAVNESVLFTERMEAAV